MTFISGAGSGINVHIITTDIAIYIYIGPSKGHNIPNLYQGVVIYSSGSGTDINITHSVNLSICANINSCLHCIGNGIHSPELGICISTSRAGCQRHITGAGSTVHISYFSALINNG